MAERYKIMFVCEWNTCRSAMAEYIMRHLPNAAGLADKILVDSAGCTTSGGEPIGRRTGATLKENHIPFGEHVSKNFTAENCAAFDLIIALDNYVLKTLRRNFDGDKKIRLFRDADGNELSIADPSYTGSRKDLHTETYEKILRGCEVLLNELK